MQSPSAPLLSPRAFRRSWHLVTIAGSMGAVYLLLCINGAPRVKFLTELGATARHFGLIAGLGSFAVAFQIVSGLLTSRVRRRKPLWMILTILHRVIFLAVLAAPWLFDTPSSRIWWIIGVLFLHDALANLGVPMWFSWMADLVPRDSMNRHWGARQRVTTGVHVAAAIAVAILFDYFEMNGRVILGFLILGGLGVAIGVADILLFAAVPEPDNDRNSQRASWAVIGQPFRDPAFRPFLIFMAYWTFSAALAWPFFQLYCIDFLDMSVRDTQFVMMAGPLGVMLSSRFWGLMCDTYGQRPVLQMSMLCKAAIPMAFFFAPRIPAISIPLLAILLFLDGFLNAAFFLSTQGMMLKHSPRQNRSMYIATVNFFAVGIPVSLASLLGGYAIDWFSSFDLRFGFFVFTGYHFIFVLSSTLRFGANYFVKAIRESPDQSLREVIAHLRKAQPFRVTRAVGVLDKTSDPESRTAAADYLGQIGSPLALRALIPLLDDEERQVRRAAAKALARIGTSEASEPLARALFDPDSDIRLVAAHALGDIGDFHSLRSLLSALRQLDKEALGEAIDSLARIGDSAAILPLVCLFEDMEDRPLRRRIAAALGKLTHTDSIDEVMSVLNPSRPNGTGTVPRP